MKARPAETLLASSRAGSLPQGICNGHKIEGRRRSNVGASLLAMNDNAVSLVAADQPLL
ncbi:hypothetical protein SAMN05216504_5306 [Pseudomonas sp. A214]|nr:hypothetical protein SAMN05216504_5306 [Pseudomonas sp. A214]